MHVSSVCPSPHTESSGVEVGSNPCRVQGVFHWPLIDISFGFWKQHLIAFTINVAQSATASQGIALRVNKLLTLPERVCAREGQGEGGVSGVSRKGKFGCSVIQTLPASYQAGNLPAPLALAICTAYEIRAIPNDCLCVHEKTLPLLGSLMLMLTMSHNITAK